MSLEIMTFSTLSINRRHPTSPAECHAETATHHQAIAVLIMCITKLGWNSDVHIGNHMQDIKA